MLTNCFRFAPRDSVPGLIAKICKYLKEHPGWSEEELEEQIERFIGQSAVDSFNGRTGEVVLNKEDVNNLKISSAYFAEAGETVNNLNLKNLYNQGVRFVFTNWNSITSAYDLSFVLDYFSGSDNIVYYPMATVSTGGVLSVNGKTGIVEITLYDILGDSGAQVKLCTSDDFTSMELSDWNSYYEEGYRIVGVVNSGVTDIEHIYLLNQDEGDHHPIGVSVGASDAYTPTNPPPYPVTSVNGKTGSVTGLYSAETPPPYPVTSVNGKTGSVTGLYSAETPPPYPVTSVNGKTGSVTGLYSKENPPPYPVTSVLGRTGIVAGGIKVIDITETNEDNQNITFLSFDIIRAGNTDSTLPAGNSIVRYLIFNEQEDVSPSRFIAISMKTGLFVTINGTAKSEGRYALILEFRNVIDEEISLSNCFSLINFSAGARTVNTFRRYL